MEVEGFPVYAFKFASEQKRHSEINNRVCRNLQETNSLSKGHCVKQLHWKSIKGLQLSDFENCNPESNQFTMSDITASGIDLANKVKEKIMLEENHDTCHHPHCVTLMSKIKSLEKQLFEVKQEAEMYKRMAHRVNMLNSFGIHSSKADSLYSPRKADMPETPTKSDEARLSNGAPFKVDLALGDELNLQARDQGTAADKIEDQDDDKNGREHKPIPEPPSPRKRKGVEGGGEAGEKLARLVPCKLPLVVEPSCERDTRQQQLEVQDRAITQEANEEPTASHTQQGGQNIVIVKPSLSEESEETPSFNSQQDTAAQAEVVSPQSGEVNPPSMHEVVTNGGCDEAASRAPLTGHSILVVKPAISEDSPMPVRSSETVAVSTSVPLTPSGIHYSPPQSSVQNSPPQSGVHYSPPQSGVQNSPHHSVHSHGSVHSSRHNSPDRDEVTTTATVYSNSSLPLTSQAPLAPTPSAGQIPTEDGARQAIVSPEAVPTPDSNQTMQSNTLADTAVNQTEGSTPHENRTEEPREEGDWDLSTLLINLPIRMLRIGSFWLQPTDTFKLTIQGIQMTVTHTSWGEKCLQVLISCGELQHILCHLGPTNPCLFLDISPSCAQRLGQALVEQQPMRTNFVAGPRQQKIMVVIEKVDQGETKKYLRSLLTHIQTDLNITAFFQELNSSDANQWITALSRDVAMPTPQRYYNPVRQNYPRMQGSGRGRPIHQVPRGAGWQSGGQRGPAQVNTVIEIPDNPPEDLGFQKRLVLLQPKNSRVKPQLLEVRSNCDWSAIRTRIPAVMTRLLGEQRRYPELVQVKLESFQVKVLPKPPQQTKVPKDLVPKLKAYYVHPICIKITQEVVVRRNPSAGRNRKAVLVDLTEGEEEGGGLEPAVSETSSMSGDSLCGGGEATTSLQEVGEEGAEGGDTVEAGDSLEGRNIAVNSSMVECGLSIEASIETGAEHSVTDTEASAMHNQEQQQDLLKTAGLSRPDPDWVTERRQSLADSEQAEQSPPT